MAFRNKEDIIKELNKLSFSVKDNFDIPVIVNSRLTKTLGRVFSECHNEVWVPVRMEFSKQLLETATEESILSVIQHEWVHYYVTKDTGKDHGHDAIFKAMCARIGCENSATTTKVDRIISEDKVYKYQMYCPTCNKYISGFSRMCKTLKEIQYYTCKKCGKGGLTYVQNW
jgi:predicted SprT family Zn-dependent metalloprotease